MAVFLRRIFIITCCLIIPGAYAQTPLTETVNVNQSVLKMQVNKGVKADDAIKALKSKADELNMKFVAHQPLSKELAARGIESRRLEIFQFCNPYDAYVLAKFNPIFAAYMPCRISLIEDKEGTIWLVMLNLDMQIENKTLPKTVNRLTKRVNAILVEIMTAGATGEF